MKLSILIPVYNERLTIKKVLTLIQEVVMPHAIKREYIIIDDGSSDGTSTILEEYLLDKNKNDWKLITHKKNQGKGAAIRSGVKKAQGEYILIQDADLEYNPKYIPLLLQHLLDGRGNIIYGTRLKRLPNFLKEERNPLFAMHYFGNRFLSLMVSILYNTWITDIETGYKILPSKFMRDIRFFSNGFDIEAEITVKLLKQGYTIKEVPIMTTPRGYNQGKKLHAIPEGIKAIKIIIRYKFFEN